MGQAISYLKPLAALGSAAAGMLGFPGAAAVIGTAEKGLGLIDFFSKSCAAKGLDESVLLDRLRMQVLRTKDRFDTSVAEREMMVEADAALAIHLAECMPDLKEFAGLAVTEEGLDASTANVVIERLSARDAMFASDAGTSVPRQFALAVIEAALDVVQKDDAFRPLFTHEAVKQVASAVARVKTTGEDTNAMVLFLYEKTKERDVTDKALLALASRIAAKVDDPNQALSELERAIDELIRLRKAAALGTNLGELIDEALRRAAAFNESGELECGEQALANAYAQLREREEGLKQGKLTVIESAIEQARLMFDSVAMADWIFERLTVEAEVAVSIDAILSEHNKWCDEGERNGSSLALDVSINLARRAISFAASPAERARAEHDLAISLVVQGERTGGEAGQTMLAEAVEAYRAVLTVRTPLTAQWAITQNNLGNALQTLGRRTGGETGPALLAEAVSAYRAAITVRTQIDMPADWAMTQSNLGTALVAQVEQTGGDAGLVQLTEAVAAHRSALSVYAETALPAQWAMTQNNLGNALQTLGERTSGEAGLALLADAVSAYRAALTVITPAFIPALWATAQNNLGNALKAQSERTGGDAGLALLSDAVSAYHAALTVHTATAMPALWAMTQNNLGNSLMLQGNWTGGEVGLATLADAVLAHRAALTVRTETEMPAKWAITQNNLGNALKAQGEWTDGDVGLTLLAEAVLALRAALTILTEAAMPVDWAMAHYNLGMALATQGHRTSGEAGLALLADAVAAFNASLRVLTPEHFKDQYELATDYRDRAGALILERVGEWP